MVPYGGMQLRVLLQRLGPSPVLMRDVQEGVLPALQSGVALINDLQGVQGNQLFRRR